MRHHVMISIEVHVSNVVNGKVVKFYSSFCELGLQRYKRVLLFTFSLVLY